MKNVKSTKTVVLVTYEIVPISDTFEESLYQHLLKTVWGERREAEEDIRVICDEFTAENCVTAIRYQFGSEFDEYLADEVGEQIDKQISAWAAKTNVADIIEV